MSQPADLASAAQAYVAAVDRGDILWSLQLLQRVQEVAMDEWEARLDDADDLGFTWDDIGSVFGMDAVSAAVEFHAIGHGPELPTIGPTA